MGNISMTACAGLLDSRMNAGRIHKRRGGGGGGGGELGTGKQNQECTVENDGRSGAYGNLS